MFEEVSRSHKVKHTKKFLWLNVSGKLPQWWTKGSERTELKPSPDKEKDWRTGPPKNTWTDSTLAHVHVRWTISTHTKHAKWQLNSKFHQFLKIQTYDSNPWGASRWRQTWANRHSPTKLPTSWPSFRTSAPRALPSPSSRATRRPSDCSSQIRPVNYDVQAFLYENSDLLFKSTNLQSLPCQKKGGDGP